MSARHRAASTLGALAAALLGAVSAGTAQAGAATTHPLVYVVVLDGLDGDKVEAGEAPFISSLLAGEGANAAYYPNSSSVIPAETNPNHVAMMSGAFPGRSGNPSNTFAIYAPLEHEDSCATTGPFELGSLPTETSGESLTCPQAEMVFEAIKRQGNPDELATAGVFGKPKLGRIFGGRNVDPARRDVDHLWAPCSSGSEDDEYCADVPTNPVSGYALDDETVMDEVIETIEQGVDTGRGSRQRPDFTFINLHQIDSAGHATGTGAAYDAAIGLADGQVERLVNELRARGDWQNTVMILLSDHSMDTISSKVSLTDEFTGGGISDSEFVALNNESSIDYVYLADRLAPTRFELLKRMREIALATPGVDEVLYREPNPADGDRAHTVQAVHPDWKASGPRIGDLFVTAKPGVGFGEPGPSSNPLPGNHGGPQTADNFLAVTGGSPLVRTATVSGAGRRANPVNADIAPTVMGLFGLFAPEDSQGTFLRKAFDSVKLRRFARPRAPRLVRRGKRLLLKPGDGRYDVQVKGPHRWIYLRRNSRRDSIKSSALGDACRVRARSYSAAGVRSGWRARGLC